MAYQYCSKCGKWLRSSNKLHKDQTICVACAHKAGPDMVIRHGNTKIELYTPLMSEAKIKRIISKCNKTFKRDERRNNIYGNKS